MGRGRAGSQVSGARCQERQSMPTAESSSRPVRGLLAARGWRGAGGQNLLVFRIRTRTGVGTGIVIGLHLLAGDEPDGCGPSGKKICAGNELSCEGWQESPVPSEETNQNEGDNKVEQRICGGYASLDEERKGGDLEGVGGDGYGPCQALLGLFQRIEVG